MHPPNEPPLGSPKLAEPPYYQEPSAPSPPRPPTESPRLQAGALETSRDVPVGYQQPDLGPVSTFRDDNPVEWSTGLCACFSDVPNCCMTCFCPCITFGQISEIIDRGTSSCAVNGMIYALLLAIFGCACMYSCFYRRRMRQQYHIKGSGFVDSCIHSCCETCSLCQEYRELKIRGFDMNLGWHANVEKQTHGVMTAPPTQAHMRR